jgi:hypothetical protein
VDDEIDIPKASIASQSGCQRLGERPRQPPLSAVLEAIEQIADEGSPLVALQGVHRQR